MIKTEQLIKELQMLVENSALNEIIEEKMMDMWRDAKREATNEYVFYKDNFNRRQKAGLTKEEKERMEKSHRWKGTDEEVDDECIRCGISPRDMYDCPQYCELIAPQEVSREIKTERN